ncbi:uncharacterized protein isoform X2 [Rhodnius prolixus]|uniref:uncharacterized protein isoform X2 n=1 Tax=Rhodnius prolixus TaxID=13249 RepID=UPI003D18CE1B
MAGNRRLQKELSELQQSGMRSFRDIQVKMDKCVCQSLDMKTGNLPQKLTKLSMLW